MRTQENREKYKEHDHKYYIKNRRPRTKIGQLELQIDQLKQQLAEKDKEIERLKVFEKAYYFNQTQVSQESMDLLLQNAYQVHNQTQVAIQELEKVNGILTDTIIEVIQNEFDLNKLCYLEEISAKFYEKIQQQIKDLKEE